MPIKKMSNYYIKWKGEISGPFSEEEIRGMSDTGKVGLLHEIRPDWSARWLLYKDFDFSQKCDFASPPKKVRTISEKTWYLGYALCGASFISPWIFMVALLFCAYAYKFSERKSAVIALLTACIAALAGIVFFSVVYPVLEGR